MSPTPDQIIAAISRPRDGAFYRAEAHDAGFTRRQIDHRVALGQWLRPFHNVLVIAGAPGTPRLGLRVAVMAGDGGASHRSAAWLLGARDGPPPKPEIIV